MVTSILTLWPSSAVGVFMDLRESWEVIVHVQMNIAENANTVCGLHAPKDKDDLIFDACYTDEEMLHK